MPYPSRFRLALRSAALGRPFKRLMQRFGLKELAAMLDLAPKAEIRLPKLLIALERGLPPPTREVLLLPGCAQQVLRPDINAATERALARRGIRVTVAPQSGCCGALVHHMGRDEAALQFARANVDAWTKAIEGRPAGAPPIEAILITASGCGTTVKDYGYMLRGDPAYAARAERVSALTRDITEYMADIDLGPPVRWSSLKVAYHSACSMQHGQRITDEPKMLLKKAGYTVVDIPEGHICCGSAGTYNILQPEIAGELRARKVHHIRSVRPDLVAAGNIGCITQLAGGLELPIVHTIELLDWAYGGPVPKGLEKLKGFVTDVPQPRRSTDDYIAA